MHRSSVLLLVALVACQGKDPAPEAAGTPVVSADTLAPAVITDTVLVDSDDPAIWIHPTAPESSFVLGTDKGDTNGGVYVFGLDGRINRQRSVTPLRRMNNVDIQPGVDIGGATTDIAVATERLRMAVRVFRLPEMQPVDGGGLTVFNGDTSRAPMGVAVYRRPRDGAVFIIVGGKSGPLSGYLAQYRLVPAANRVTLALVREFGTYSGRKEIEAIAVDDALGYVYYSDEGVGVRKYHADPDSGDRELALFATMGVVEDHEGLAVASLDSTTGFLVLSDQGGGRIHIFPREGMPGAPHQHPTLAVIPVRARDTDGLEVTTRSLGPAFPKGMLAMMSNRGAFHFYRWEDVEAAIQRVRLR